MASKMVISLKIQGRKTRWEKLPASESQTMRLEQVATTEQTELCLAVFGHPRKTQRMRWRWWTGARWCAAQSLTAANLPNLGLSKASDSHYFGWRWWWMPPVACQARPSLGSLSFTGKLVKGQGKIHIKEGPLTASWFCVRFDGHKWEIPLLSILLENTNSKMWCLSSLPIELQL